MYESFFRLQEAPFSTSPDPRFFFLSSQHKEALAKCQYAVQQRMGLAVIYGDVGTGKTTIARRLFQTFSDKPDYKTAMIISPGLRTENALLREIMKEFGVQTRRSFADSRAAFHAFLAQQYAEKRTVVLMVDEAQTIHSPNFELIRALLNFETDRQKLLNIILLGQSELARKLDARPELKSRVTIFGALTSLSREDAERMIQFRLTSGRITAVAAMQRKRRSAFSLRAPRAASSVALVSRSWRSRLRTLVAHRPFPWSCWQAPRPHPMQRSSLASFSLAAAPS